jgi:hypothetical protein
LQDFTAGNGQCKLNTCLRKQSEDKLSQTLYFVKYLWDFITSMSVKIRDDLNFVIVGTSGTMHVRDTSKPLIRVVLHWITCVNSTLDKQH